MNDLPSKNPNNNNELSVLNQNTTPHSSDEQNERCRVFLKFHAIIPNTLSEIISFGKNLCEYSILCDDPLLIRFHYEASFPVFLKLSKDMLLKAKKKNKKTSSGSESTKELEILLIKLEMQALQFSAALSSQSIENLKWFISRFSNNTEVKLITEALILKQIILSGKSEDDVTMASKNFVKVFNHYLLKVKNLSVSKDQPLQWAPIVNDLLAMSIFILNTSDNKILWSAFKDLPDLIYKKQIFDSALLHRNVILLTAMSFKRKQYDHFYTTFTNYLDVLSQKYMEKSPHSVAAHLEGMLMMYSMRSEICVYYGAEIDKKIFESYKQDIYTRMQHGEFERIPFNAKIFGLNLDKSMPDLNDFQQSFLKNDYPNTSSQPSAASTAVMLEKASLKPDTQSIESLKSRLTGIKNTLKSHPKGTFEYQHICSEYNAILHFIVLTSHAGLPWRQLTDFFFNSEDSLFKDSLLLSITETQIIYNTALTSMIEGVRCRDTEKVQFMYLLTFKLLEQKITSGKSIYSELSDWIRIMKDYKQLNEESYKTACELQKQMLNRFFMDFCHEKEGHPTLIEGKEDLASMHLKCIQICEDFIKTSKPHINQALSEEDSRIHTARKLCDDHIISALTAAKKPVTASGQSKKYSKKTKKNQVADPVSVSSAKPSLQSVSSVNAPDVKELTLSFELRPEELDQFKPATDRNNRKMLRESKPVLKPESKPVLKPESKPVLKPESKPVLKPESKPDLNPMTYAQQPAPAQPEKKQMTDSVHHFFRKVKEKQEQLQTLPKQSEEMKSDNVSETIPAHHANTNPTPQPMGFFAVPVYCPVLPQEMTVSTHNQGTLTFNFQQGTMTNNLTGELHTLKFEHWK